MRGNLKRCNPCRVWGVKVWRSTSPKTMENSVLKPAHMETHTDLGGTRVILLLDFTKFQEFGFLPCNYWPRFRVEKGKVEISPPK